MKNLRDDLRRLASHPYAFPTILLLLCLVAFGLFIPQLGFYWDDWLTIFMAQNGDPSILKQFYSFDRPLLPWTFLITIPILGTDPQHWQIFALLLRFLTAFVLWRVLSEIWPKSKFIPAATALLFVIYPSFFQQQISVTYVPHFFAYLLFFLSVWCMLRAIRRPERYFLLTLLGLVAELMHLAVVEYFGGLEFIRPFLVLLLLRDQEVSISESVRKAFRHWAPYLIVLVVFVSWRLLFVSTLEDANEASLIGNFVIAPVQTTVSLIEHLLQDLVHILFSQWNGALNPTLINFSDFGLIFSLGMATLVTIFVTFYLIQLGQPEESVRSGKEWGGPVIALGTLAVLMSMLPAHIAEKNVLAGLFSDRLTLAAAFGATLFWVGIARLALKDQIHRALFIGILVGLAAGLQIRTAHAYRLDFEKQTHIYWQLYWRAPSIAANTALIFDGALSGYVDKYAASASINTLYGSSIRNGQVDYWVLDYYDDLDEFTSDFPDGFELAYGQHNLVFRSTSENILLLDYSTFGQCLWVLDALDQTNVDIPLEMRQIAGLSNVARINPKAGSTNSPSPAIFGSEPEQDWCYYYEKMDLAQQNDEWPQILDLWEEAREKGYRPNNQFEMIPVLDALQNIGEWEQAFELSRDMYKKQLGTQTSLCSMWLTWANTSIFFEAFKVELREFNQHLGC
jgi:hypothetical protein